MELKFNSSTCHCLRKVVAQVQNQEQTQEVRLPDTMPDIGRVLGSWGQVLVRSKEWRGNGMSVSGGVMAWVLYAPEDGSEPRSMEVWIPFQMRWDFEDTDRDGFICVVPLLKAIDARSTSARKLMVRANISLLGEALEPSEQEVYSADSVPEDVQLLTESYPMDLPQESGEKLFQVDEELTVPNTYPTVGKILRYEFVPQIAEKKVMAGRLVFRGSGMLHMLYSAEDGGLNTWDTEIPFSQYAELDRDYGPNATAWVMPMLTSLDLDIDEQQRLQMKCGMAAQYVIYDRMMVDVVEDAYSPNRTIKVQTQELKLPMRLDRQVETMHAVQTLNAEASRVVDVCWLPDHPVRRQNGDVMELTVPGQFQALYYDGNGNLQGSTVRGETTWEILSDLNNRVDGYIRSWERPMAVPGAESVDLSDDFQMEAAVFSEQPLCMVTGLELGEWKEPDPARPALILRRAGACRLWEIAKECGSTVDAIRKANKLQEEPENGKMLLIPVS